MWDDMPLEVRRLNYGWFGDPWPSGVCYKTDDNGIELDPPEWDWDMHVEFPTGEKCFFCQETFVEGDSGQRQPYAHDNTVEIIHQHKECLLRQVMGPLAHMEKRCKCFGGTDHNTPGLTERQEALAVWERWSSGRWMS